MPHVFKHSEVAYEWSDEYVCKYCGLRFSFAAEASVTLAALNKEYKDSACPVDDARQSGDNHAKLQ